MEKLRNQYREVLIERDNLAHENKRVRHDYDVYVKQNDQVFTSLSNIRILFIFYALQDKFCLRDELNTDRTRLLEVEKELLISKEQCLQCTNEINRLQVEVCISIFNISNFLSFTYY